MAAPAFPQDIPPQGALVKAVAEKDQNLVRELLQRVPSPDEADQEGMTPLAQAVMGRDKEMVRLLLKAGADPNVPARALLPPSSLPIRWTPLMFSVYYGDEHLMILLLAARADLNAFGDVESSPPRIVSALSLALDGRLYPMAERLITAGADSSFLADPDAPANPHFPLPSLEEPLTARLWRSKAALADSAESIDRIQGSWELLDAARRDDWSQARALLDGSYPVDGRDTWEVSPLMVAAYHGSRAVMSLLINRGARVNAQDKEGRTALVYAAGKGNLWGVHRLLAAQAAVDPPLVMDLEQSALYAAVAGGHSSVVTRLLEAGASPNRTGIQGLTPLMAAAWNADYPSVRALLSPSPRVVPADGDLLDEQGRSAVSWGILAFQRDRAAGRHLGIDDRGSQLYPVIRALARQGKPPAYLQPWPVPVKRLPEDQREALSPDFPGGDLVLYRILKDQEPLEPSP